MYERLALLLRDFAERRGSFWVIVVLLMLNLLSGIPALLENTGDGMTGITARVSCTYSGQVRPCEGGNSVIGFYAVQELHYFLRKQDTPELYRTLQLYNIFQPALLLFFILVASWILRWNRKDTSRITRLLFFLVLLESVLSQWLNIYVVSLLDNYFQAPGFRIKSSTWHDEWHIGNSCLLLLLFLAWVENDRYWRQALSEAFES